LTNYSNGSKKIRIQIRSQDLFLPQNVHFLLTFSSVKR
jgi:hypothetical protein